MLTARGKASASATLGVMALAAVAVLTFPTGTAAGSAPSSTPSSSGPFDCPPNKQWNPTIQQCILKPSDPGSPSSTSSTSQSGGTKGGDPVCHYQTRVVPCSDKKLGWYDGSTCYYKLVDPQPPSTDLIWQGEPSGGAIYDAACFGVTTFPGGTPELSPIGQVWLQNPPPNYPVTPGQVAQMAIAKLVMHGPNVGVAPPPGSYALVGVPVWLWTADDPQHTYWGPQTQSATAGNITVTATAQATQIEWHMGDGNVKVCQNPGTQYGHGASTPACSYAYTTTSASAPEQKFTISGITTWVVNWSGAGQSGTQTFTLPSAQSVQLKVESAQAVNQH